VLRFRIFKELKKRLKRNRRHAWSLGIGAALFLLAVLVGSFGAYRVLLSEFIRPELPDDSVFVWSDNPLGGQAIAANSSADDGRGKTLNALRQWSGDVEVILHRSYICGEETRKLGRHSASETIALLQAHREWDAVFDAAGKVVMEEIVDDLSPLCRKTAYIGMDNDGNLSLFSGPPEKEKVLRTFFQLDIESLETNLPVDRVQQLVKGIRVTDKDEYNSVISTFSDYARGKTAGVMNPAE